MYYGLIYLTKNKINGMMYVGQTTKPQEKEYYGSGKRFKEDYVKYGRNAFTRNVLCCCVDKESLAQMERHFIKEFDAVSSANFYNISSGGHQTDGSTGYRHTEEHKQKIRKIMLERHPNKGKQWSPEIISRMSDGHKNRPPASELQREHARQQGFKNRGRPTPIVRCPHCGKEGGVSGMNTFHFDKCKFRNSYQLFDL